MDKELLEQYEDACRLVEETKQDLRTLRRARHEIRQDSVKGSNPEFPYEPMSFHIEGLSFMAYNDPRAVERTEKLLQERLTSMNELKHRIEAWMNTLPPRISRIVRMRYIKKMTWEQVSANMGFQSKGGARMELERFFQKEG